MNPNIYTWFKRKRYGGWGIMPASWQGWALMLVLLLPLLTLAPFIDGARSVFDPAVLSLIGYIVFFVSFMSYIMMRIEVDERELLHEALADRNALWALITVLLIDLIVSSISPIRTSDPNLLKPVITSLTLGFPAMNSGAFGVDPFILGGLLLAWAVKMISLWRLSRTQ